MIRRSLVVTWQCILRHMGMAGRTLCLHVQVLASPVAGIGRVLVLVLHLFVIGCFCFCGACCGASCSMSTCSAARPAPGGRGTGAGLAMSSCSSSSTCRERSRSQRYNKGPRAKIPRCLQVLRQIPTCRKTELLEEINQRFSRARTTHLPSDSLDKLIWLLTRVTPNTRLACFHVKTWEGLFATLKASALTNTSVYHALADALQDGALEAEHIDIWAVMHGWRDKFACKRGGVQQKLNFAPKPSTPARPSQNTNLSVVQQQLALQQQLAPLLSDLESLLSVVVQEQSRSCAPPAQDARQPGAAGVAAEPRQPLEDRQPAAAAVAADPQQTHRTALQAEGHPQPSPPPAPATRQPAAGTFAAELLQTDVTTMQFPPPPSQAIRQPARAAAGVVEPQQTHETVRRPSSPPVHEVRQVEDNDPPRVLCKLCGDELPLPTDGGAQTLPCGHTFHSLCVVRYMSCFGEHCPDRRCPPQPGSPPSAPPALVCGHMKDDLHEDCSTCQAHYATAPRNATSCSPVKDYLREPTIDIEKAYQLAEEAVARVHKLFPSGTLVAAEVGPCAEGNRRRGMASSLLG